MEAAEDFVDNHMSPKEAAAKHGVKHKNFAKYTRRLRDEKGIPIKTKKTTPRERKEAHERTKLAAKDVFHNQMKRAEAIAHYKVNKVTLNRHIRRLKQKWSTDTTTKEMVASGCSTHAFQQAQSSDVSNSYSDSFSLSQN